jgi:hypothetical protein
MPHQPLFAGLVFDERNQPVETTYVGDEPNYVVDDDGFRRHIPSEKVDRQILEMMQASIEGHESLISQQAAEMLGQDDIFSRAMIESQLKNIDQQFDALLDSGIPEEARAYMGMVGFKIIINIHGEVIDVEQPGMIEPDEE